MTSELRPAIEGYVVSIPTSFHQLPLAGTSTDEHLERMVASFELDDATAVRLLVALRNVTRLAHAAPSDTRMNWALLRLPESGRVDALLSLEMLRQQEGSRERYRDAARSTPLTIGEVELIKREVSERTLIAGPAIVVHDFDLPVTDGGVADPGVERSVVALFPPGFDKVFEFALVTQDLALFENAADYLVQIVSQVHATKANE